MSKIIAIEILPENQDFSYYFDGDCFTSRCGDTLYAVYILGNRSGYNREEYNLICAEIDELVSEYNDGSILLIDAIRNVLLTSDIEIFEQDTERLTLLQNLIKDVDARDPFDVAKYLTIKTNMPWKVKAFHGCCQGDYCQLIYCSAKYCEKSAEEIGKMWLGCGSEF